MKTPNKIKLNDYSALTNDEGIIVFRSQKEFENTVVHIFNNYLKSMANSFLRLRSYLLISIVTNIILCAIILNN